MGAGASIATESRLTKKTKPTQRHQVEDKVTTRLSNDGRNDSTKVPTSIDARIVATLRLLNLTRRADPKRNQNTHFERIVLQFALVREAFSALRSIYQQLASTDKDGLDFEGLKMALIALGIHINEYDLTEIFYESDMVRDNSLSQNEFVVSLAIAHLLGLITICDTKKGVLGNTSDDVSVPTTTIEQQADQREVSKLINKALDLMVSAYLLFDHDASGTIQTCEVLDQMRQNVTGCNSPRRLERINSGYTSKVIHEERLKELDFDQDGTITFQEFVLTFQRWAGSDDEEE
ncbi:putative serine/threonine-protein phosphatase with EF-hands [Plasmopara halstedii]